MEVVTGDRYLESLVKFVEKNAEQLIEGSMVLKLNPVGLHYVYSRLDALSELEGLRSGAPVDYLRAYISDLGDHRAIEQLRRILCRLTSLKVVSVLAPPARDPTPLSLFPFGRLKALELRGCDLSTSSARGLLELRHSLEKLVCHNSTDALRHIFASRISEIKDSPQWDCLSFVSCACNRLVLMDESLQLLPAVETLDLSRNKFTKVDNLRKCTKLAHLDLGFNQLRSAAPFREITHIVKLVLRNNSLTTLQGIENLKSLEGLDLSYNIISNFSELEVLSALPSLRNLWLEGNPFCCARWYRPQAFSYFPYPDKLKLDDKGISTREFWKRQIVIARRQTKPASYGFYSPAREDTEEERLLSRKTKKLPRLASIESEERRYADQDSLSSGNEIHTGDEKDASVEEPEVPGLINRIEVNMVKSKPGQKHVGENLKYETDSSHTSEYRVSNILESENSSAGMGAQYHHYHISTFANEMPSFSHSQSEQKASAHLMQDYQSNVNIKKYQSSAKHNSHTDPGATQVGYHSNKLVSVRPTVVVNEILENSLPSDDPRSPPHFQEDILHRLHDLEEEILQHSADSYSVVSSDSDTSSNEYETVGFALQCHNKDTLQQVSMGGDSSCYSVEMNEYQPVQHSKEAKDLGCSLEVHSEQMLLGSEFTREWPDFCDTNEETNYTEQEAENLKKVKHKTKVKQRVVPLLGEDYVSENGLSRQESGDELKDYRSEIINNDRLETCKNTFPLDVQAGDVDAQDKHLKNCVENYFNSVIAHTGVHETCKEFISCSCIPEQEMQQKELEVVVVLSSEGKLYSILTNDVFYGSGNNAGVIASFEVEDISDIWVGLGLQVVRVYVAGYAAFLYITKNAETSRHFLGMLEAYNSTKANYHRCLRSLECVQMDLFGKSICGLSKVGVYQYSMVRFRRNDSQDEEWISRSLFVCQGHLFVCIEDVRRFSSLSEDAASSDYFFLDSACCITDVSELVIEGKGSYSVTLKLEPHQSDSCLSGLTELVKFSMRVDKGKRTLQSKTWSFKWLSEATFINFVTLLKAIHAQVATSALSIRCVS